MKIRNTAVPAVPSAYTKLDAKERESLFHAFDIAAAVLRENKVGYMRRYSEPCKGGWSYRCKFWGVWSGTKKGFTEIYKKITTALEEAGYGDFDLYSYDGNSIFLVFDSRKPVTA